MGDLRDLPVSVGCRADRVPVFGVISLEDLGRAPGATRWCSHDLLQLPSHHAEVALLWGRVPFFPSGWPAEVMAVAFAKCCRLICLCLASSPRKPWISEQTWGLLRHSMTV